jgi:hypothetical protein
MVLLIFLVIPFSFIILEDFSKWPLYYHNISNFFTLLTFMILTYSSYFSDTSNDALCIFLFGIAFGTSVLGNLAYWFLTNNQLYYVI